MITFEMNRGARELTLASAREILDMLKMPDTVQLDDFPSQPVEERTFYEFFLDVLIEQDLPCNIDIDWKWHPEDILWQLQKYLPNDNISLVRVSDNPEFIAYDLTYTVNGATKDTMVNFSQPDRLLDEVTMHLAHKRFVALDFLEDRYAWLIVPKEFNNERFSELTGFRMTQKDNLPLEKRDPKRSLNTTDGHVQTHKIFFAPTIFYVENEQTAYLLKQHWAGRVLPGQTIRQGIAVELKSELAYTGRFDYIFGGYESTLKDKKG